MPLQFDRSMRIMLSIATLLAAALFAALPALAEEDEEIESTVEELEGGSGAEADAEAADEDYPVCFITEERWDVSPSRVETLFRDRGSLKRVRFLNLAYMIIGVQLFADNKLGLTLDKVFVVDYPTFGTDNERMIEVGLIDQPVWFVWSDQKLPGSRAPYITAFTDEQAALDYSARSEGKVMSYDDITTKIIKQLKAGEVEYPMDITE